MTVHISSSEAKRLGLQSRVGAQTSGCPPVPTRTTRRAASGPYHSRCHACGEEFTTMAGETRHLEATAHRRYEIIP